MSALQSNTVAQQSVGSQRQQNIRAQGGKTSTLPPSSRFGHVTRVVQLTYTSALPATPFSGTQNVIDFKIYGDDQLFMPDNRSIVLWMKCTETGGSNSVTPNFVESLFDKNNAIEWLMNGSTQISTPISMLGIVMLPLIQFTDTEYTSVCNLLNHNNALTHGSVNPVAASGTAYYAMIVPNYFPRTGFYWGALGPAYIQLRLRTQSVTAIYGGSGTLGLTDMNLYINGFAIPGNEAAALKAAWANQTWTITETQLFENPQTTTLVASGDISVPIQLQGFRDLELSYFFAFIHLNRSFTSGADYWDLIELPKNAKVYVTDRTGSQLWTTNKEYYFNSRYLRSVFNFGDSKVMQNLPVLMFNPCSNIRTGNHLGHAYEEGIYHMTGDEYLHLEDSGLTSAPYFDFLAVFPTHMKIDSSGRIMKINA